MKQGKGVWKKNSQEAVTNTYEGEYFQDMKHGMGEFRWASGGHYKGQYQHDIKCGFGEMHWADGSMYRGQWQRGIQNGLGIMTFANGTRKAGIFKENVLIQLITEESLLDRFENDNADNGLQPFPETFKQEIRDYIRELGLSNQNN